MTVHRSLVAQFCTVAGARAGNLAAAFAAWRLGGRVGAEVEASNARLDCANDSEATELSEGTVLTPEEFERKKEELLGRI